MSSETTPDWQARADELQDYGVPRVQAQVVALREADHTYSEIAAVLGFGSNDDDRSQVTTHLEGYRRKREQARDLLEHGPEL